MLPVIAIIGRPNVGKSTLFNQLTRSRQAIVFDLPGLTRDRQYGQGRLGGYDYLVIDTGGLSTEAEGIDAHMKEQSLKAIEEADAVLFIVDGRSGVTALDQYIVSHYLRGLKKPIFLVVNKTDGLNEQIALSDFYSLGLGTPLPIAAAHGRGVSALMEEVHTVLPTELSNENTATPEGIMIAIVGRPNVGKSTLVNRMLGEDRVVVYDQPGTTRDSIFLPFSRQGKQYTLIDTAGIRRRGKVNEAVEKFSVIKTLQSIQSANVVILVVDARQGLIEQDLHIAQFILDAGRAIVLAINKWDNLSEEQKNDMKNECERRLGFLDFARHFFISALHGTGVGLLYGAIHESYAAAMQDLSTPRLTSILEEAVKQMQPPMVAGRRIKLRYAHGGGHNPPIIVIHGNQAEKTPENYQRYLVNYFRKTLKLIGTPLLIQLKTSANPYKNKQNKLTPLQRFKHAKKEKKVKKS